jgi:peptide/nickel transport system permease protein
MDQLTGSVDGGDLIRNAVSFFLAMVQRVFKRKPAPDLIRGGSRFASRKRVKPRIQSPVSILSKRKTSTEVGPSVMRFFLFAIRRLAASVPTLLIVLAGLFMLLQFAPGDTVDALMAQMGGGDSAMMEQLRKYYGLDATATVQLVRYLTRLVQLDLGFSAIYGKPVIDVILERLPATLLLMASSLSFAFAGGLVLGVLAARRVNQWPDGVISTIGAIFYATPAFWLGLMGIIIFAVNLRLLPAGGLEEIGAGYSGLRRAVDIVWHLALPTATLGLIFLATYLRIMRASMLEVMTLDFVRTARAKGLAKATVLRRHVLRNALLPMVTLVGLQAGTMLGGSVVVESVFALPGLGRLAYEAVVQRDLNTLLGIVFVSALLVICVNFLVDILYARLDPRIAN